MTTEQRVTAGVTALLVLVGIAAWVVQLRTPLAPRANTLAGLPYEIDGWRAFDIPLEDTVEKILRADFNIQRAYVHPTGALVWLYVGYYGTDRGGAPEHTPWGCYPAAGWEMQSKQTVSIDPERDLYANEFLVEREGEQRLVQFWFRSYRRTGLTGNWGVLFDHMLGRIRDGRADGGLVRISTRVEGEDVTAARSRLFSFGAAMDRLLTDVWPVEKRTS